jgi:hypothetical protein
MVQINRLKEYAKFLYQIMKTKGFSQSFENFFLSYVDNNERDCNAASAIISYFYFHLRDVVGIDETLEVFGLLSKKELQTIIERHQKRLSMNLQYRTLHDHLHMMAKDFVPRINYEEAKVIFPKFPLEIKAKREILMTQGMPKDSYRIRGQRKRRPKQIKKDVILLTRHHEKTDQILELISRKTEIVFPEELCGRSQKQIYTKPRVAFTMAFLDQYPECNEHHVGFLLRKDPDTILWYKNLHLKYLEEEDAEYQELLDFITSELKIKK